MKAPPWQTLGRQRLLFRCPPGPPPHSHPQQTLPPRPPKPSSGPHQWVQFWVSRVPGGSSWACSSRVKVWPQGRESWAQGHAAGGTHVPLCSSWAGGAGSSYTWTTTSSPTCLLPHAELGHVPTFPPGQPQPSWQGSCTQRVPGCRCEQRRGHKVAQALSTWPGGHSGGSADEVESQGGDSFRTHRPPW